MRRLLAALSLPLIAAAPQSAPAPVKRVDSAKLDTLAPPVVRCKMHGTTQAQSDGTRPPSARNLSEMPNARLIKTVIMAFAPCNGTVIVREDIGGR